MSKSVKESIENLYIAFADIRKPHFLDGCPCCIDKKEIGTLLSKPLRELSPDELESFTASVFNTVGGEEDFKYFLPRIFELSSTTGLNWYPDPEIVLGKLNLVQWKEWDEEKRNAIECFLESVFVNFVLQAGNDPNSWLCAIAIAGVPIKPLLKRIENNGQSLITLYELNSTTLIKKKLFGGFWDEIPDIRQTVIDWFQSEKVTELIDEQYQKIYGS